MNVEGAPEPERSSMPPRLQQFQDEVERLKLRRSSSGPERRLLVAGVVLFAIGVAVTVLAFSGSSGASDPRDQTDFVILALVGVGLSIGGAALWLRYSMSRYLRYWLIRLVYEQRQQTDDLVEALRAETREAHDHEDGGTARSAATPR